MRICKTRYIPVGDYFIPDWTLPEENGTWGRMRRNDLKELRPILYSNMVWCGTLWTHLAWAQQINNIHAKARKAYSNLHRIAPAGTPDFRTGALFSLFSVPIQIISIYNFSKKYYNN